MNELEILELKIGASKKEIKKAYRKLAHQYHPDKGGDEAKMKEINNAYAILINPPKIQQPIVQQQWYYYRHTTYGTAGTATTAF